MIFLSEIGFYGQFAENACFRFYDIRKIREYWEEITGLLSQGESMIYVGSGETGILKELWIDSYKVDIEPRLSFCESPVGVPDGLQLAQGRGSYIYIRPDKSYVCHGIDEEIRADMYPIIEARGRYGDLLGYPAVMVKNYDSSLVKGRFKGSRWYFFLFDQPEKVMDRECWDSLFKGLLAYDSEKCYLNRLHSQYPIYDKNENIRIECRITNPTDDIVSTEVRFEVYDSLGRRMENIGGVERCLNCREEVSFSYDWYPEDLKSGSYKIKAFLYREDRYSYAYERENSHKLIDSQEYTVLIKEEGTAYPELKILGTKLVIDGKDGFLLGANYYPSSSWYDGSWRNAKVDRMEKDLEAMVRHGISYIRIWTDPILDEDSLRGMDACFELCRRKGIAVIVTVYTAWPRWIGINLKGIREKAVIKDYINDSLIGLYLYNVDVQAKYLSTIVQRNLANTSIIWNISNEFAVMDPLEEQIDKSWIKDTYKDLPAPYGNNDLFMQWSGKMVEAIKSTGSKQYIIIGMANCDAGTDNYITTRDADILVWHTYDDVATSAMTTMRNDVTCIGKPLLIEEFGVRRTGDFDLRDGYFKGEIPMRDEMASYLPDMYEGKLYHFLGTTVAGACSYEWGVSWLADSLPYLPPAQKYHNKKPFEELDGRVQRFNYDYSKSWPDGSIGICPWAASFEFGMNYPCTPCPSPAMKVFKRFSLMGEDLGYEPFNEEVYVVIPMEFTEFVPNHGYQRKVKKFSDTVDFMWKNGIVFGIWQEDALDRIPGSVKTIILTNEDDVKEETAHQLERLESLGVKVYKGTENGWMSDTSIKGIKILPSEDVKLMARRISSGTAYIVENIQEKSRLSMDISGSMLEFDAGRYSIIVEKSGNLVMVESIGHMTIGGQNVIESNGGRYIAKALDGRDLRETDIFDIIPYGPVLLKAGSKYTKAEILDSMGRILDKIILKRSDGRSIVEIDAHMADYRIRIS